MIDDASGTFVPERDNRLLRAQTKDLIRLVLAQRSDPEHALIERGGALQIIDED